MKIKDVAAKHKYNPNLYFLMKFGVWILFSVIIISSGVFIWNIISKAFLSGGYFIDSTIKSFLWRASLFLMMYSVFFQMISPFLLWLDDCCQKYKYGSVGDKVYENNQSKFQSAQREYWTQWKKLYKSDLTYEEWKKRINATIVFKDADHDL